MKKISWEKTGIGNNVFLYECGDYLKGWGKLVNSTLLKKNIVYTKMLSPALISGSFNGFECYFDPFVVLIMEEKSCIKLHSVYKFAFAGDDEDENDNPNLLIRSAKWDLEADSEKFAKAPDKYKYLLSDEQFTIANTFIRSESYEMLNVLTENLQAIFLSGIKFKKIQRPDQKYHRFWIKCENQHTALTNEVGYCPMALENSAIESWISEWGNYFESEKFEKNFSPDGDVQLSYEFSLSEKLNTFI